MLNRRRFLSTTAAGFAALHFGPAFAQDAPQIQIFVPAAPGGGWDQTARTIDQVLRSEKLISGSQITNVGGAGGTVGLPQFVNQWKGKGNALMVAGMVMVGAIIANKAANNLTEVTPIARLTGEFEA
ncbi:MAG: tripartite tricarboxylate transporter substrate binding protein, partial [Mesorhizobium sp.]